MKKGSSRPVLSILVPVYNEENTIAEILERVTKLPIKNYEVLIVDDASKDNSRTIINNFYKTFKKPGVRVRVLSHTKNRGKGAGIKTGLQHATGRYFIIQDADLEYDPADIPALLAAGLDGDRPVVYGSRFTGDLKNMARPNFYANRFYNFLLRRLYPTSITDMHTCYKMVKTDIMQDLKMTSEGFGYATELVSKLLRQKINIYEVPISFNGRTKQAGKKIGIMDGFECTSMIFRYRFNKTDVMDQISDIYKKKKLTIKFGIIGGVGFVCNYLVLKFSIDIWSLNRIVAEVAAALVALQVTFFLHDKWTYRIDKTIHKYHLSLKKRYRTYLLSNSAGSLLTVLFFSLFSIFLGHFLALALAAAAGLVWNFLINKNLVWHHAPRED